MKVTTCSATLTQLTSLPYLFPVNCYLVREEDGLTLIDAALPFSTNGVLAAARNLGAPIRRLALTHAHMDHVGALDALHAALPEAEILVPAREARFLAGDRALEPDEAQKGKLKGSWKTSKVTPTRLLRPGDLVGSLEVQSAPGHTPGHMAYFDRRDGALIAGDALQTLGGVAVSGDPRPLFPFPAMGTWSAAEAVRSAQALQELDPTLLVVGHGRILRSPRAAMETALRRAEARLAREVAHGA